MNDQITLAGFEPEGFQEEKYLESILPNLLDAIEGQGGERSFLSRRSSANTGGYSTVSIANFTAFRLHLRGKRHYISVPKVFSDLIPDDFPQKQLKSDTKYTRILIDGKHPVESYTDFLVKITGETINRYPKEWSCCSHYLECSDAKTCIHPDKTFALACGYRRILNSGRVFYGNNRNI